jgi:FHS family L-fucose permease-like MFS transporter
VACNPYVAALGTPETAPSRLNLSQAFNSLGAAIAPWLGGMLILSATTVSAVKGPYLAFAAVLFGTAVVIGRARLPLVARIENQGAGPVVNGRPVKSAWRVPHLVLGAVAILLYCGAEVSIGSFLVNFLGQPEIGGLSPRVAARYASYYWTAAMIGRFAGSALLRRLPAGKLLGVFGIAASLLVWIAVVSTGAVALWSIVLVGLFNSIMFPTIFTLAIDGLGRFTSQGSGILFLAVLGPAVLPVIQGALADRIGIQNAFVLPALCYLYVVYYGFRGCRERPLSVDENRHALL